MRASSLSEKELKEANASMKYSIEKKAQGKFNEGIASKLPNLSSLKHHCNLFYPFRGHFAKFPAI